MKKALFVLLIFSIVFTTGCWDMTEINERIFPYSVGIDLNKEENGKGKFIITFSYPNINSLGKSPTSDEKEFILSTEANNIFDAIHHLSDRTQQPIYLKHLKVLIISEDIARDDKLMRQIIDGLNRDYVLNKMINLLVTKESAKDLIEVKIHSIRQEDMEGIVYTLLRNDQKSIEFTPKTLNTFIKNIDISSASIVPLGSILEEEIKISGGAVFKDYKLVGYINGKENKDIALLNGNVKESELNVDYEDANLSVLIMNSSSKKKQLIDDGEELRILCSVNIEGQINGYILNEQQFNYSNENIKEMERQMEEKIEKELKATVRRLQEELNADVIGVSEYLYKFHPNVWNKVMDDWDEIFPNIDIDVDVEINIRRRGLVR
ncbi:Ger(x)C family spore germination protein [Tissierellaceae bacterium HCP3S3_D8]